jgi:outer membrane protein assembly factor BamD
MIGLKNRLARYDLSVAEYYVKRCADRRRQPRQADRRDLSRHGRNREGAGDHGQPYDSLKMPTLAQHAREVLAKNYPDNRLGRG